MSKLNKTRQYALISGVITFFVVVVLVILNVFLNYLFQKYPLSIDMTSKNIFELSKESKEYIQELDKEVEIYILSDEATLAQSGSIYISQVNEVIKNYQKYSDKIKVNYINILQNPDFVNKHSDLNLSTSDIVILSGNQKKKINFTDLFEYEQSYSGAYPTGSKAEQVITAGIMNVMSEKLTKAVVLTDAQGEDTTGIENLLSSVNYDVEKVSIITGEINPDADILVLSAPKRDLNPDEISKIDKFLDNNGNMGKTLLYFASVEQQETTNIDAFLKDWGIEIDNSVIYETDTNRLYNSQTMFAYMSDYAEEEYSKSIIEKNLYVATPLSRPVKLLFDSSTNRNTKALLSTGSTSYKNPFDADENYQITQEQDKGPFNTLVMGEKAVSFGPSLGYSQVIVAGSSNVINQDILLETRFANAEYFVNILNTLYPNDVNINIPPKNLNYPTMNITLNEVVFYEILFIVFIPLALLIFGIIKWVLRLKAAGALGNGQNKKQNIFSNFIQSISNKK